MAAGRPIVFGSLQGEAIRELEAAGGALTYPSDSPEELSEIILKLRSGQIDGEGLGQKYHDHIARNHLREIWARQYLDYLEHL